MNVAVNRGGYDIAEPEFQPEDSRLWKGAVRPGRGLRLYELAPDKLACHSLRILVGDRRRLGQRQRLALLTRTEPDVGIHRPSLRPHRARKRPVRVPAYARLVLWERKPGIRKPGS